jgi:hypothetical protein
MDMISRSTILRYTLISESTGVEACFRSAHCEGINSRQAHNLVPFLCSLHPLHNQSEQLAMVSTPTPLLFHTYCAEDSD